MEISSSSAIQNLYTKKLSADDVKAIKKEIAQNMKEIALHVNEKPNSVDETINKIVSNFQDFQSFLESVGYDGKKSVADLSKEEGERMLQKMFEKADFQKLDIKV
ncbi:hypothetical protein FJR45_03595 [Sulfurimonas sediminis]|uniref:Uncharacterized protein n=1 Tax=Sulfurimonas sediminis TaxID=2590020 RepID=A0A7M1B0B3_9BACT|nr:hypothetical protein [Sulfurimonas sediminis]QOP43085.1 hypothetical protein FJR45_03595 [Sulfurimonas sediminis]